MWKLLIPFVLLFAAVGASVLSDRPLPRADFTFINRGDVTTLDLHRMSWMQDLRVARIVFEGLISNDVMTWEFRPRPGVAERWEISEDQRTYTFHLRENARWSNGEPVTAEHFVYSWRRALLPDTASDYFKLLVFIKGGLEFYQWRQAALEEFARAEVPDRAAAARELWEQTKRKFAELVSVSAPDSRTLVVTLVRPVPYFLDLCAFPTLYPVYPPLVEQYQTIDARSGAIKTEHGWTKPPHLVSNGPFKVTLWRFKRDMRLERNEHYWDSASLHVRSMSIPSIEDPNAQILAFRTGAVDWVSDVTAPYRGDIIAQKHEFYAEHQEQVDALRAQGIDPIEIDRRLPPDPRNRISVLPAFGTYFYNFNCLPTLRDGRPNPFADARVRRAFAMAIDKQSIVDTVRRTGEPVAGSLVPPGSIAGYEPPAGLPFDPVRARALLAEAGWPDPSKFITVELLFNKDSGHDLIAQVIAKNWQEHLGVPISLEQKEIKVFREDLKNANYITARAGWFGDYGDPTTFLYLHRTGDGNNDRKYSNPAFDALLEQAEMETDPAKRMAILRRAEVMIVEEELPVVPIFHYSQFYLFDPHRVTGISAHPRQEQALDRVDILGDGLGADAPQMLPPRVGGASRSAN